MSINMMIKAGLLLLPIFLASCKGSRKDLETEKTEKSIYKSMALNLQHTIENVNDFTYEVYLNVSCYDSATDKYIALLEQIIKSSDNDKRIHYISTDNFNCNIMINKVKINDSVYIGKKDEYLNISTKNTEKNIGFKKYYSGNEFLYIHGNKENGNLNLFLTDLQFENFKYTDAGELEIDQETKKPIIIDSVFKTNKKYKFDKDYTFEFQYRKSPDRLPFKIETIHQEIIDVNNNKLSESIVAKLSLEKFEENKLKSSFKNCYIVTEEIFSGLNLTPEIVENSYKAAKNDQTNKVIACSDFKFNSDDNWKNRENKIHFIIYTSEISNMNGYRIFAINKIKN